MSRASIKLYWINTDSTWDASASSNLLGTMMIERMLRNSECNALFHLLSNVLYPLLSCAYESNLLVGIWKQSCHEEGTSSRKPVISADPTPWSKQVGGQKHAAQQFRLGWLTTVDNVLAHRFNNVQSISSWPLQCNKYLVCARSMHASRSSMLVFQITIPEMCLVCQRGLHYASNISHWRQEHMHSDRQLLWFT